MVVHPDGFGNQGMDGIPVRGCGCGYGRSFAFFGWFFHGLVSWNMDGGLLAADLLSNILSGHAVPQQDLELVLDVLQRLGISYVELFSTELGRYRLIVHTDSDNPLALLVDYLMEEQSA